MICRCVCNATEATTNFTGIVQQTPDDGWVGVKRGLVVLLVVLVVLLVILLLIIGFHKIKHKEDEDMDEYFGG